MSEDRCQRVEEAFQRAAELPLAERARFLDKAFGLVVPLQCHQHKREQAAE